MRTRTPALAGAQAAQSQQDGDIESLRRGLQQEIESWLRNKRNRLRKTK